MFVEPCIINVVKQNQQDATLHNGIYYYKCFRRFLRPSSGAQNCIHGTGVFVELFLLLTAIASELELVCMHMQTHANQFQLTRNSGKKQKKFDKYPGAVYAVLSS